MEQNMKAVNEIFLGQFDSTGVLTGYEAEVLEPIANQCPYLGGPSVFEARSILASLYAPDNLNHYKIYNDDSICYAATGYRNEGDDEIESKQNDNEIIFNIFPNPAADFVSINFYAESVSQAVFELFDVTGRMILQKNIYSENGEQQLQLSGLTSGVYLYKVKTESEMLVNGKLVIIK